MRVFVAGATGVVGRPLCRLLLEAGHQVSALTRSAESGEKLHAQGIAPVVADVFDEAAVVAAVAAAKPEGMVHQLTAIPARSSPRKAARDFAPTNKLRVEGTRILLAAARAAGATRFVAQSISFVLAPEGPEPADESEPVWRVPGPSGAITAAAASLETQVTEARGLTGIALRYGSFYGPGTVFGAAGAFCEDVQRRRVPIVGDGAGVFSFIHVEDAARATVRALTDGAAGVYNVVDDEPAKVRDWLPFYAECVGARPPLRVPAWAARWAAGPYGMYLMTQQRGVSNRKAREALGWAPQITSWRQGFRDRRDS